MLTKAEQYFNTERPGFVWKAKVKMAPLIFLRGRDRYYQGKGNMLIKLMALFPVANESGDKIDQGALLRYLGEIVWFPTVVANKYIEWEAVDDNSARATMSYGDITASAVFKFNDKGQVVEYTCQRFMAGKKTKKTYQALLSDYEEYNGINIPAHGEAIWKLKEGDFSYYKFKIDDIKYNETSIY
jgi:hypothetical protein